MGKLAFEISMSLDGFVAGPNQSGDAPLGEGGEQLHEWAYPLEAWRRQHGMESGETDVSSQLLEESIASRGATIMGRKMFGGGEGPWGDEPWEGWWGDDPPFGHPVFVLTDHEREPLEKGDTTFTFVTDGIESAAEQAQAAAGGMDVLVAGGANVAQQYLKAGLVDELLLHVTPILLGGGERLFENVGADLELEQAAAIDAPGVTHLRFRVAK